MPRIVLQSPSEVLKNQTVIGGLTQQERNPALWLGLDRVGSVLRSDLHYLRLASRGVDSKCSIEGRAVSPVRFLLISIPRRLFGRRFNLEAVDE